MNKTELASCFARSRRSFKAWSSHPSTRILRRPDGSPRLGGIEKTNSNLESSPSALVNLITPQQESKPKKRGSIFDRTLARLRISLVTAPTSLRASQKKGSTMTRLELL